MSTRELSRKTTFPSVFDDFFKPWNEWFDGGKTGGILTVPAVNVTENHESYTVSLAVPGVKKDDLKIDVDGNMITISSETEVEKEEKDEKYTRKEYNYNSFSRTFTIPEDVRTDSIQARYENGVLNVTLPRIKTTEKTNLTRKIEIK